MRQETFTTKSKENLNEEVVRRYGKLARTKQVTEKVRGGVNGFFASRDYEVKVEIPESGDSTAGVLKADIDHEKFAELISDEDFDSKPAVRGRRRGAPMMSIAPETEATFEPLASSSSAQMKGEQPKTVPDKVHTIPEVVRMVSRDTASEPLVVYVGLFNDPLDLLGRNAYRAGALNDSAQPASGEVAFGLGDGSSTTAWAEQLKEFKPSRVVAVVDPSRKHEDSALWVHELAAVVKVAAVIAAPFAARTLTAGTLDLLGRPVITR